MSGKLQTKTISKALPAKQVLAEVIILALLGAAAVALRARLRIHINMPGHHGLEVMALFMIARNFGKLPFAGTVSSVAGASLMLIPFFGFQNPYLPLIYILMGAGIDILFYTFRKLKPAHLFFILTGAVAYSMIPLSRLILHVLSIYPYNSILKAGVFYTLFSHFIWGAAGALLASGLIISAKKIRN